MSAFKKILIVMAIIAVVIVGGTYFYIHVIEDDPKDALDLQSTSTTALAPTGEVSGSWKAVDGSEVGYRVKEVLFGQSTTAVGRSNSVDGSMQIEDDEVTSAIFTVDTKTFSSDQDRRDGQFNGRIMETDQFPNATFELSTPIDISPVPTDNSIKTYQATGKLTMHGVTNDVTFDVKAQRSGDKIRVNGSIPITFADYNIENPSFGPAEVGETGTLEFLLVFSK